MHIEIIKILKSKVNKKSFSPSLSLSRGGDLADTFTTKVKKKHAKSFAVSSVRSFVLLNACFLSRQMVNHKFKAELLFFAGRMQIYTMKEV